MLDPRSARGSGTQLRDGREVVEHAGVERALALAVPAQVGHDHRQPDVARGAREVVVVLLARAAPWITTRPPHGSSSGRHSV